MARLRFVFEATLEQKILVLVYFVLPKVNEALPAVFAEQLPLVIGGSFSWQSLKTPVAAKVLTKLWPCSGSVGIVLSCHPLQNMMVMAVAS